MVAISMQFLAMSYALQTSALKSGYVGPVEANGMTFQCGFSPNDAAAAPNGDVMLLHGNDANTKERFYPMMEYMNSKGYRTLACDNRGFSPGASPQTEEAYNYNELQKDIFALADWVGFGAFHVVAHDQGARLSWHALAYYASQGRSRFRSLTSLSIPHTDVFSESVYGPLADPVQQAAFQYMTVFTLDTPESLAWSCKLLPEPDDLEMCQRRTWWYKGGVDSGNLALPPKMYDPTYGSHEFPHANPNYGDDGVPSRTKVNHVSLPILYVCGALDNCGKGFPFSSRTRALSDGAYTYLKLPSCGHSIMECSKTWDAVCEGDACGIHSGSGNAVWDAVMGQITLPSLTVV